MAQQPHAAPTSVTIAATEEESFLQRFVKRYWLAFAGLAVLATIAILVVQAMGERSRAERLASWSELGAAVDFGDVPGPNGFPTTSFTLPDAGRLAVLADDLQTSPSGPWAKALEVGKRLREDDLAGAQAAAEELRSTWPEHPLNRMALPLDPGGEPRTLAGHLQARLQEVERWEAERPGLFGNPPLPEGSPQVTLVTSKGEIVLGLYAEQAPEHVEHFLAEAEAGAFEGTKFHRVDPGVAVYAGDPNSVEGDPETWGLGGDETVLPLEENDLHFFANVLGMDRASGSTESSGRRFFVTLADQLQRDGNYTAFGTVVAGEDVLAAIASGPLDGIRPQDPIVIESTRVTR